ncbi:MAG: hypothetical protein L0Y56_12520, partial [Nitrospira sp.]|nr:hypothetical protein [Nitrospira sp.]
MTKKTYSREKHKDKSLSLKALEEKIQDLLPKEDEEVLGKAYDPRLARRLIYYIRLYGRQMIWALILMVITSLLSVAGPWIVGHAIDEGIRKEAMGTLRLWTGIFIAVVMLEWITNYKRISIMAYVGTKIVADLRSALFSHLQTLSLNFYSQYSVGRLMSRLISDVGVLQEFVAWSITGVARASFTLLGIVVAMLALNGWLALVTFMALLPMVILANYWRVHIRHTYRSTRQRLALINGYLNESISGIRVTKSFNRERENFQHFKDLNTSFYHVNLLANQLSALFFSGVDFTGSLAMALVVGVGGWLVVG